jgi:hypothetical protein
LQCQIPNADGRVRIACGGKISKLIAPGKKYPMKKFVLVSPEIDKDKRSIASIVCANKSEIKIVRLKFRQLNCRDFLAAASNSVRGSSPSLVIP